VRARVLLGLGRLCRWLNGTRQATSSTPCCTPSRPAAPAPQSLESTVVSDNTLVNTSLALLYGVFTFMTILAPRLVSMMGPKA
jgi:hypothetical protein